MFMSIFGSRNFLLIKDSTQLLYQSCFTNTILIQTIQLKYHFTSTNDGKLNEPKLFFLKYMMFKITLNTFNLFVFFFERPRVN